MCNSPPIVALATSYMIIANLGLHDVDIGGAAFDICTNGATT
jgi:hypothetical protein